MKLQVFAVLFMLGVALAADPVLVGVDNIGLGYDITTGKTKMPALQMSYEKGNTWYNPYVGQRFAVPDDAYVALQGEVDFGVEVYASFEAFAAAKAEGYEAGEYKRGAFYEDEEAVRVGGWLAAGENVVAQAKETLALYEVVVVDRSHTDDFSQRLQLLNDDYNEQQYHDLINDYGTHIVAKAVIGGEVSLWAAYKAGVFVEGGAEAVVDAAATKYKHTVSGYGKGAAVEGGEVKAGLEVFVGVSAKGGLWEGENKRSEWTESVARAPARVKTSLVPISDLVDHPTHKMHLQKAIHKHTYKAHEDLQDKLSKDAKHAFHLIHM